MRKRTTEPSTEHNASALVRRLGSAMIVGALVFAGCDNVPPTGPEAPSIAESAHHRATTTIETLLGIGTGPVAIAHRGMGPNLGEDPTRPIENTVAAVREGFEAGAAVVEVDLQMTGDGEIVAFHDDFLPDLTCLNTLTREQLEARAPHIPSLQAVLRTAQRYNRTSGTSLGGLLSMDLKPASPLCDPDDSTGPRFVTRVVEVIRHMGAADRVFFNSMSPVLLGMAAVEAPEIERQLTVLLLQLLSPEQVEAALGLPVTLIEKSPDYGLQWGEVGPFYRLPGYDSPQQAIGVAFAADAQLISYDLALLGHLEQLTPGFARQLVQGALATGLHVYAGDVSTAEDWAFGAALGVEALYTDDIPLALSLQPPLP